MVGRTKSLFTLAMRNYPSVTDKLLECASLSIPTLDKVSKIMAIIKSSLVVDRLPSTSQPFSGKYHRGDICIQHYVEFLKVQILEEFNRFALTTDWKYFALYFAVVQSSGYGKTRLLLEAGRFDAHTIYTCLRAEGSQGYPNGNAFVRDLLIRNLKTLDDFKYFLSVVYHIAAELATQNRAEDVFALHLHRLEGDDIKFAEFWTLIEKNFKAYDSVEARAELIRIVQDAQSKYGEVFKMNGQKAFNTGTVVEFKGSKLPSEIVFVLDEAKILTDTLNVDKSVFRYLRRAHNLMGFKNFVLVFVDTVSSISESAPSALHDASLRPVKGMDVLPVYYQILTYDSCASELPFPDDISREHRLAKIFSRGRPLWYALYFNTHYLVPGIIQQAIAFAKVKLTNMAFGVTKKIERVDWNSIAAITLRFGVNGISDYSYGTPLVADHMATVLYFGEDRIRLYIRYVAEPILAEGACQYLYFDSSSTVCNIALAYKPLCSLDHAIVSGLLDFGEIDEFSLRLMLGLSHDFVHAPFVTQGSPDYLFTDGIPLRHFLDVFIPPKYREKYRMVYGVDCFDLNHPNIQKLMAYGWVAFTSFNVIDDLATVGLTEANLKRAFEYRYAFSGPHEFPGCDCIISVEIRENGRVYYGALIIQMKSYTNELKPGQLFKFAGKKLGLDNCFRVAPKKPIFKGDECMRTRYMSLLVEHDMTDSFNKGMITPKTVDAALNHFEAYGNHAILRSQMDLPFLSPDLRAYFENLKTKHIDLFKKQESRNALMLMNPHGFSLLGNGYLNEAIREPNPEDDLSDDDDDSMNS